jgi:hypothetical protein
MASKILVDELAPQSHATDVTLATGKNITGANTQFKITGGASANVLTTDGAGVLSWGAIAAGFTDAHVDVSSGSEIYTVPTGVTKLLIFITGGGGSGAAGTTAVGPGFGGGSAGTVMARVTVVAADTITLVIGAGGVQTADTTGTIGNVGGDSTFTHSTGTGSFDAITAPGGRAGPLVNTSIAAPVTPTVGSSNAGIAISGGFNAGTGGGASFWGQGGATGIHALSASTAGVAFGSGGGSGTYSAGRFYGSAGADGVCFIMEFK